MGVGDETDDLQAETNLFEKGRIEEEHYVQPSNGWGTGAPKYSGVVCGVQERKGGIGEGKVTGDDSQRE